MLAAAVVLGCADLDVPTPPPTIAERTDSPQSRPITELYAEAMSYARSQPSYAGQFLERDAGNRMVFLFHGDIDDHRQELERRIDEGLPWDVRSVPRSLAELQAFKDEVRALA